MSCKGCADRRARIAAWFRRKLGIDEIITNQGERFQEMVNAHLSEIYKQQRGLLEAGAALESALSALDDSNAKLHRETMVQVSETKERMNVLRELIREGKSDIRKARDLISAQDLEISELQKSVNELEFPGFESVDAVSKTELPS